MPDQAIRQLLSALDTAPLLISSDALSKKLAENVEAIPQDDLDSILMALLSVYSLRQEFDVSVSELVEHLTQAMQKSGTEELRFADEEQRERFEQRLVGLLTSSSLDLIGKASELTTEQERFMREARIVTDIRPIFEDDSADNLSGAVITHTLKISYWDESNQGRDFYLALDAVDLGNLRASLERAEAKARSLRSILDRAEIPLVELE